MSKNVFKSYSNLSNAKRAVKSAGLKEADYILVKLEGGKVEIRATVPAATAAVPAPAKVEAPSRKKEKAAKVATEKKPRKKVDQGRNQGGYHIEKKREKQNGITRYSDGTMGAKLWECFDKLAKNKGGIGQLNAVMAKDAANAAGLNATNAGIEFYCWRRFNGVRGRLNLKKAQKKG